MNRGSHKPLVRLDQSAGQLFLPWKKARQLVDREVELAPYAIPGKEPSPSRICILACVSLSVVPKRLVPLKGLLLFLIAVLSAS